MFDSELHLAPFFTAVNLAKCYLPTNCFLHLLAFPYLYWKKQEFLLRSKSAAFKELKRWQGGVQKPNTKKRYRDVLLKISEATQTHLGGSVKCDTIKRRRLDTFKKIYHANNSVCLQ